MRTFIQSIINMAEATKVTTVLNLVMLQNALKRGESPEDYLFGVFPTPPSSYMDDCDEEFAIVVFKKGEVPYMPMQRPDDAWDAETVLHDFPFED